MNYSLTWIYVNDEFELHLQQRITLDRDDIIWKIGCHLIKNRQEQLVGFKSCSVGGLQHLFLYPTHNESNIEAFGEGSTVQQTLTRFIRSSTSCMYIIRSIGLYDSNSPIS